MVPKVNKFDFYTYEIVGGKIIQLVGESRNRFEPKFLTEEEIINIRKRAKLCGILSEIEFRIENNGLINFFVYHDDEFENFKLLKELLIEFNDINSIEFIEKSLQFLEENKEMINYLKSNPNDFESKHNELQSRITFNNTLYESTVLIDNEIRKNPNNFCFDENGNSIDPNFNGALKKFYHNGNLQHEYNFVNGKVHGEGIDYNFEGNKDKIIVFKNGRKDYVKKRWRPNGQLKYEKTDKTAKEWYPNQQLKYIKDYDSQMFTLYYDNGIKKMESDNLSYPAGGNVKRWDENGNLIQ